MLHREKGEFLMSVRLRSMSLFYTFLTGNQLLKKTVAASFVVLLSLIFTIHADSATRTWLGSVNSDALNDSNWSGGQKPVTGDDVIFDSSSPDCNWNINPSLQSFSLSNGFNAVVTLNSDLTMTGDIAINSGTLKGMSATITLGGDWNYFRGTSNPLGDIDGDSQVTGGDADSILNMAMGGTLYYCSDINKDSSIDILDVVLAARKSLGMDNPTENCTGGRFIPGSSTVVLNGTDQTISGDTIFYNLKKTVTALDTLYFESGSVQTILGGLTLKGSTGGTLELRSTIPGTQWYIDPHGSRNIAFASIQDMNNLSFIKIIAISSSGENQTDNNTGVSFGGDQCVCREDKLIFTQFLSYSWRMIC